MLKAIFTPTLISSILLIGLFLIVDTKNVFAANTIVNLSGDSSHEYDVEVGAVPGNGSGKSVVASSGNPLDVTIDVNGNYSVTPGAPDGTTLIITEASSGPSGSSGPLVNLTVNTGSYKVTPGALVPNGITAAVQGVSKGSNGGNGGDTYVAGNAGDGGTGANGGSVTVTLNGSASATNGTGLAALSLAGNGGNGGSAYVIAGSSGSGGLGGYGGDATATLSNLNSSVSTVGNNSVGVLAFSQGGNGGSGGGGGGLVYSAGGGSPAGRGGHALVSTDEGTSITTTGDYSYGIEARSLGGGGGSSSGGFGLFYSGGGGGSTGGNGGMAEVSARGLITTSGNYAQGILAQSIGGGGGDAGTSLGLVALGGDGSAGGSGGTVQVGVASTGSVRTSGFGANAIEAQSIGGSGGNGASSGGLVSLGGKGSDTTVGGAVTVSNSGMLTTAGAQAAGILAQSIGGGGGNGGTAAGLFAAGGSGGSGADGGSVIVSNGGNISAGTNGLVSANSPGILAQSIGGGGGNGGGAIAVGPGISAAFGGDGAGGGKGGSVAIKRDNIDQNLATAYHINTYGDQSSAVVAQSIGGGGGNGGFAVSASGGALFSIAIGVAGSGGFGGDGGLVSVGTKGTLSTVGSNSDGILAQSIGGGGGNGGFSVSASVGGLAGVSVAVGGSGGTGGNASDVTVSNLSNIDTYGANSYGIAAQSLGGGGGNGGFTAGGAIGALGVSVGVGGKGGSGGSSGTVTVNSSGSIITWRDNSTGILAQSLGGGGGNGGFSAIGTLSLAGSVSVGVGGSGGIGQIAEDVIVTADGGGQSLFTSDYSLVTFGQNADGILAQSIGGGGGNGGFAGTLALSGSASAGISLGGSGGIGNSAGTVSVTSGNTTFHNNIYTDGDNSNGILAQSIGGGGGNGGFAVSLSGSLQGLGSAAVTLGGNGGSGATGNSVIVNSIGNIKTNGDMSAAIFAQSVGGGGGNGGFSAALSASTGFFGGAVAIGGSGSGGGNGGSVIVNSTGDIQTSGMQSSGILAQSVGGGGGNGGFAGSGALSFGGVSAAVGLGGSGSSGGDGSTVDVTSIGNITTTGDEASAIIAQSVGGGGGNGGSTIGLSLGALAGASVNIGGKGDSGGNAAAVTVHSAGNLSTGIEGAAGNDAYGILAQSIGGGGGNGGFSGNITFGGLAGIGVSVGGSGGSGGKADQVIVTGSGNISTFFDNSSAILAQSLGGGGGNGGFSFSAAGSASFEGIGAAGAVSVGGFGGTAGASSVVTVNNTGTILTQGFNSHGIEAQSLGGGGGNGGLSVSGAFTVGAVGIGVSVGGFGAGGGDAGAVMVNSYSTTGFNSPVYGITTLETDGDQSNGIFAQSLGGGGGNGGFSATIGVALQGAAAGVSVGGFGSGGGNGEVVSVTSYNNILTQGDKSNGILAQSIGGGGGNGGFSIGLSGGSEFGGSVSVGGFGAGGGDASSVTVKNYGTIWTKGADSNGIEAQSLGGGGGNGGFSIAGAFTTGSAALGVSVGGFGAGGGDAGAVEVDSYAKANGGVPVLIASAMLTLETDGDRSNGILAQSIGGGGGNGGFSGAGALSPGGAAIGVSVGGSALGGGGLGNTVTVTSVNNILTLGDKSNGILAQSIGGGGGNGGFSIGLSGGSEFAGALSVGGFGSEGGDASSVTVQNFGTIWTKGNDSNGIEAQSLGGGGGNGGFSIAGAFTTGTAALGLSVGGFGNGGGNASAVKVESYSHALNIAPVAGIFTLETDGDRSNGILAQSIGGGGGNGGFSGGLSASTSGGAFTASVGGFGAGGGNAGIVTVTSYNNILTKGEDSNGILAQSLGGGGGNGGFSIGLSGGTDFAGSLSVGGFATGGGGDGSTVTVNSVGTIKTGGDRSNGIEAQSIGGRGGNGGFSLAGSFALGNAGLSATIGGAGSDGGLGGDVTVNSTNIITDAIATIETTGQSANGIEAQSIGGGGGNGGFSGAFTATADAKASLSLSVGGFGAAGNSAGAVNLTSVDNILTHADGSNGILAQSVGGGGGNGGFSFAGTLSVPEGNSLSLSASLGGFGGSAGDAGTVMVASTGRISTLGNHADGVVAQSLGGGGGNGGLSVAGTFNFASANNVPSITASVGGFGGSGGAGHDVSVTRIGDTVTISDESVGILAQSIGGGGGNGGLSVAGSIGGPDSKQISASVGGFGGAGSEAGIVTVNNTGNIKTGSSSVQNQQIAELGTVFDKVTVITGRNSDGILAQSIGGGGGNGGFSFSGAVAPTGENTNVNVGLTVGGFGGDGGTGDNVNVTNHGLIQTIGPAANGIEAQSIGGGGGNGGSALTGLLAGGDAQAGKAVNVAVSVGGMGGDGNIAGDVLVEQYGGILTEGAGSNGILAQSIGGGGGNGGGANSLSLQLGTSCTFSLFGLVTKVISSVKAPKNPSVNVQVDIGGWGGTGNDAGNVTVTNHDFITTTGNASAGIMAQSIGGGGGNGGQAIVGLNGMFPGAEYVDYAITAVTLPISTTGLLQGLGRFTLGGFGGASGDGFAVNVTNNGLIQTSGSDAYGIFAQSIGGGGGIGGNASSGITGLLSIGGGGGASGDGGAVTVINKPSLTATANITTTGYGSTAIFAQSVGGGGGNGGSAGGLISLGGGPRSWIPGEVTASAGNGGTVSVSNDATLHTTGGNADGIEAQSIGGGGGNGGSSGLSGIAVGGKGGASGDGGDVTVTNSATAKIVTEGAASDGIFAQSVGGGGGNGGGTGLGVVTIGGNASGGGNGGRVTINSYGTDALSIKTTGDDAVGLFGQSIGGGGGNGGATFISAVGVGGKGGSSGNGGEVDITNTAWISTSGKGSDAIRAQSIGGGGGSAGGVSDSGLNGIGLIVSVGGSGSGGGTGGQVSVDNANKLHTVGDAANGIFAQSIGGGGGIGGGAIGAVVVGGNDGQQGDGGDVTVMNREYGIIWTQGSMANGIFAQSVGGGGGVGGGNSATDLLGFKTIIGGNGSGGGNGGAVTVDNYSRIETDGFASQVILAQSVGGGGGNGGVAGGAGAQFSAQSLDVAVGGNGGSGGNGGAVIVNNYQSGTLVTNGANSTAIFAQSVGGGGGNGGGALTGSGGTSTASVILGGDGGGGGNGGNVTVVNNGHIEINANNSIGIMAQSVGGGGGTAGSALGVAVVPVSIGGQNGVLGTGGDVSVTNTGSIIINGDNSVGIFAQSVGGGGGLVQPGGGASSLALLNGGNGIGGTVTINNTAGSITVTGANSVALYSQSVGGGGGAVGLASDPPGQIGAFLFSGSSGGLGAADDTIINQTGDLIAHGVNSIALMAQSDAPGGTGNIIVNILNAGSTPSNIEGGSDQGAGVYILNGADNWLNNHGIITTVLGVDGFAVRANSGNDNIDNFGRVIGSVDLSVGRGTDVNSFHNEEHAVFDSGVTVYLGAGNLLTNDGLLRPGGCQNVLTTNLTGDFLQTSNGTYGVDLDLRNQIADRLNITGTGNVSGAITLNLIEPEIYAGYALPGQHNNVLISATGGVSDNGITFLAPNTVVAHYSLLYPNLTDIDLNYVIDYSPSGLTQNQHSVGNAINQIQLAQISPAFRPVASALFFQPDTPTLARIYDSLSGEGTLQFQRVGFLANDMFFKAIAHRTEYWLSKDTYDSSGHSYFDPSRANGMPRGSNRNWRVWMNQYHESGCFDGDPVIGSANFNDRGDGFAFGLDKQISCNTLIGVAAGHSRFSFNVPDREMSGNVDALHIAGYGAILQNNYYVTASLGYDHFNNDEKRHAFIPGVSMDFPCGNQMNISGFDEYLSGVFQSSSFSADVEAGYKIQLNTVDVTPFVGLKFGSMSMDSFTETKMWDGMSQIGLSYDHRIINSLPLRLGMQLKTKTELSSDALLSVAVSAAWKHEFEPERSIKSSFITAPGFDFVIQGSQSAVDSMLSGIGLNLTIKKSCALFVNFQCDTFGVGQSYAGMAGLHISW
ncbi:MAG: hypothetical protein FDX21_03015 [Chlorobium sp.]|nr:MAG: hypothetical protein FDX21_03015 [Chlorobium sp.]